MKTSDTRDKKPLRPLGPYFYVYCNLRLRRVYLV